MVITYLFAGAIVLAALRLSSVRMPLAALNAARTAIALVAEPAFVVVKPVVSQVIASHTPRYGRSLLAVMVIVLASAVRGRFASLLLGAFTGVSYTTLWVTILLLKSRNLLSTRKHKEGSAALDMTRSAGSAQRGVR